MIECFVSGAESSAAALDIGEADEWPNHFIAWSKLATGVKLPIENGLLKASRSLFAPRIHKNHLPEVVLSESPLTAVGGDGFFDRARCRPAQAVVIIGGVESVIDRPNHSVGLMLEITSSAAPDVERLFFIGDAVAVGVGVNEEVVGVGFADDDPPFIESDEHSGEDEFINKDGMFVVDAIAL